MALTERAKTPEEDALAGVENLEYGSAREEQAQAEYERATAGGQPSASDRLNAIRDAAGRFVGGGQHAATEAAHRGVGAAKGAYGAYKQFQKGARAEGLEAAEYQAALAKAAKAEAELEIARANADKTRSQAFKTRTEAQGKFAQLQRQQDQAQNAPMVPNRGVIPSLSAGPHQLGFTPSQAPVFGSGSGINFGGGNSNQGAPSAGQPKPQFQLNFDGLDLHSHLEGGRKELGAQKKKVGLDFSGFKF